jgi:hypothetical protein
LFNGGTLKSLANYTTGTADQYYNTAFNQAQSQFATNQQAALGQIGALTGIANQGLTASGQAANLTNQSGQQQSANTLGGAEYGANLGYTGAANAAQMGLTGATTAGQFGLTGAQLATQALTNKGNAEAAGTVGSTNAWLGGLSGATNSLTSAMTYSPQTFGLSYPSSGVSNAWAGGINTPVGWGGYTTPPFVSSSAASALSTPSASSAFDPSQWGGWS